MSSSDFAAAVVSSFALIRLRRSVSLSWVSSSIVSLACCDSISVITISDKNENVVLVCNGAPHNRCTAHLNKHWQLFGGLRQNLHLLFNLLHLFSLLPQTLLSYKKKCGPACHKKEVWALHQLVSAVQKFKPKPRQAIRSIAENPSKFVCVCTQPGTLVYACIHIYAQV